jgi:hypothetical protein
MPSPDLMHRYNIYLHERLPYLGVLPNHRPKTRRGIGNSPWQQRSGRANERQRVMLALARANLARTA